MRTLPDRLRHTLMFEGIAIGLVMVLITWVLDKPVAEAGGLALVLSLMAMAWNFIYNLGFDALEKRHTPLGQRSLWMRVVHALGFEGGFLLIGLPVIAWWLGMGLWQAFIADIAFAVFFLAYAFVFNWAYDQWFPVVQVSASVVAQ